LAELSKYEILINDLSGLEARAAILQNQYKDTIGLNRELELKLNQIQKENNLLSQKVLKLENEIESLKSESENKSENSLNVKEKEELKGKIENLISKIDYHLSS
jgi:uncharacterized protein YlxW (UPF0749 family)